MYPSICFMVCQFENFSICFILLLHAVPGLGSLCFCSLCSFIIDIEPHITAKQHQPSIRVKQTWVTTTQSHLPTTETSSWLNNVTLKSCVCICWRAECACHNKYLIVSSCVCFIILQWHVYFINLTHFYFYPSPGACWDRIQLPHDLRQK